MKLLKYLYFKNKCKRIVNGNAPYAREKYEDRNVLETIIFPYLLAYHNPQSILDIGREDYQAFYNEFFTGRELWTIDYDPKHIEFGASEKHIVDSAVNIKKYFKNDFFDFILMNGVMGWGLNEVNDIEKAISGIVDILKPGGIFIIGWNNFKDVSVTNPDKIKALKRLKPTTFPPLKSPKFECVNGNHTYNFYKKI